MARVTTTYVCSECESQSPVQLGKCPRCGSWGSMQPRTSGGSASGSVRSSGARRAAPTATASIERLADVSRTGLTRVSSGLGEVDRVLGGGWVAGAALLIAGEPGIGKSTLLLQLAHEAIAVGRSTLYVAGEESPAQVKLRAERLGISSELHLTRETDARILAEHIRQNAPKLVIVDSVQTLLASDDGTPGSLTQVRDGTALLTQAAKDSDSTLVLIGHITKQGSIAGPKVIEHMVDATLALESASGFRVLRAMKNRFGAAGEVGVFEMTSEGMTAIANPSEAFLAERPVGVPGSVVVATLEGQRPLLLEVQALAAKSPYASPRRIVQGLDARRVDVVLAVLERRLELPLANLDVYVNVAGGLRLTDPGTDLAVALAVYSAVTNRPVPEGTVVAGEVGLAGELRRVNQLERRALEADRAGFRHFIGPQDVDTPRTQNYAVSSLAAALQAVWEV
ncbi:MAG: DNA repair protein RadA [Trueperaceae bacterium]|nr:DNA repair protein RadA [Trueperaceae bacterium]